MASVRLRLRFAIALVLLDDAALDRKNIALSKNKKELGTTRLATIRIRDLLSIHHNITGCRKRL
jgi:hypothetical protein